MLVNGQKLEAISLAMSKTDEDVYALNHLYIEKDGIINASNGICLYWTDCESDKLIQDYPIENKDYTVDLPVLIPFPGIKKAVSNVPKKPSLSILENILIDSSGETGKINMITTDLNIIDNVEMKRGEGEYPNISHLKKTTNDNKNYTKLSIHNLDILVKVSKKLGLKGTDIIQISISNPTDPVFVLITKEDKTIEGLLMPCIE